MHVYTKYGEIEGIKNNEYTVYKGIPYARPPVGELRWREPQAPEPWMGVFKADTFSPKCPQDPTSSPLYKKEFYSDPDYLREDREDCLYLNIWVPEGAKELPVAFWIHGGGFGGGYGSELEFDGETYCKKGIILVTIQYRVNIFGFLAHPWLDAENCHRVSGNFGILDQIAALNWVYENIGAFGGNPRNITVFGQSAGSSSVQTLVSTRLTGNRIARAIMQSGGGYDKAVIAATTRTAALEVGGTFVKLTGVKNLRELRSLNVDAIHKYRKALERVMHSKRKGVLLLPNIDGYVLEDSYDALTKAGKVKNIPYMLGSTELDIFVDPEDVAAGKKGSLYESCKNWSFHMQQLGRKNCYVYYFKHHLPGDDAGAFHSAELWYIFNTLARCWRPMEDSDYQISEQMVGYWTNFMKTGDPNGPELEDWEPCTKENPFVKEF